MSSLRDKWLRFAQLAATVDLGSARTTEMRELAALAGEAAREALDAETRSTVNADVADLRQIFVDAWGKHFREHGATDLAEIEGVRAVIERLAALGTVLLPSDAAILEQAWPMVDRGAVTLECAVLDVVRSQISHVLGALQARVADLEVALAERGPDTERTPIPQATPKTYFIQDTRQFVGNSVLWWRVDGHGYTCELSEAWEVDEAKAQSIERSRDTDKAWPAHVVRAAASTHVDMQKLRRVPTPGDDHVG